MNATVVDPWEQGGAYERYMGRWSRRVAPEFLAWLDQPAGLRWLDLGCGTGALCGAILDRCAPSSVVGVEPSEGFRATAKRNLAGRAEVLEGSATALPLPDGSVDVVVSGLVLNFVGDVPGAMAEMRRVTHAGGILAAYVWDYAGEMEYLRVFWDAAVALDPAAATLDEGTRFPLCRPEPLAAAWRAAGFDDPEVRAIETAARFENFEEYWEPFMGGQGPAPGYVAALGEGARAELREEVRRRLPPGADGSVTVLTRAWAVRASVPAHEIE